MYRDTSSVDCTPRELTHACSNDCIKGGRRVDGHALYGEVVSTG